MRWHVYTWTEKSVLPDNNMRSLLAERDEQAGILAIGRLCLLPYHQPIKMLILNTGNIT